MELFITQPHTISNWTNVEAAALFATFVSILFFLAATTLRELFREPKNDK